MRKLYNILFLLAILSAPAFAEEGRDGGTPGAFRSTNLPIPRFVSLRTDEVFVRSGPGMKYPVKWVYKKLGLPVEIVLEYDAWRKIKDSEGEEGWVHQTLLTGKRTGLIARDRYVPLYEKAKDSSKLEAQIEPGVIVELKECKTGWCQVNASGYGGWVERQYIWGLYNTENFD